MVLEALQDATGGTVQRTICPFCVASGKNTRKKKLDYHPDTGWWSCWRCGAHGRLHQGADAAEAHGRLERARKAPSWGGASAPRVHPPHAFTPLGRHRSFFSEPARRYALNRGITEIAIAEGLFGYVYQKPIDEDEADFRGRLVVPILAPGSSEWIGYVGRDYTKQSSLPYLYARGMKRGGILYREEILWEKTDRPALVVEGTLDAAFLWPDGVAVLGTWDQQQIELFKQAQRPLVALLDGDAWRKGEALAMTMTLFGKKSGYVRLPPKKDPDEMDRSWLRDEVERCLR